MNSRIHAGWSGQARAETKLTPITIGRTTGASGFHIPYFVGVDRGFFKDEGLDAKLVAMTGKALVTAGLGGAIDVLAVRAQHLDEAGAQRRVVEK